MELLREKKLYSSDCQSHCLGTQVHPRLELWGLEGRYESRPMGGSLLQEGCCAAKANLR